MAKSTLAFLTPQLLEDYAGSRSFERGRDYFDSESVFGLEEYEGKVVAKVSGTRDYRVKLWAEDDEEIGYDCNCPYADEGNFCKHCVAVGLAWIARRKGDVKGGGEKKMINLDEVKAYLQTREKTELIEMLMQQVLDDDALRGRLMLSVARHNPQGVDVKTYRAELERVFDFDTDDYDDEYYGGFGDSDDIESVIESIQGLFDDGHYEMVVDLCEYGLELVSKILNYGYESDGSIEDAMENLKELHLAACEKAKPDPEILANRLFELEMEDDWDTFHGAAQDYADVLGKKGLRIYRELIEKEWAKVPALKPKDDKSFEGNRFRITSMMESLAYAEGDIERIVEIKSRDLSSQYRYYEIAEIYRSRRKYDKALEWAERGISDFPKDEKLDWRLGEFLANEYHRRGRHDEAMQIVWQHFAENISLGNYANLKEHAEKIKPAVAWQKWREKALELIRRDIAERKKNKSNYWSRPADNSLLVQIFLQENLAEEAWQEAQKGGCGEDLWLKLAEMREKEHPADALKIYRDRIEPKIEETNNQAYEQAVVWIKEVKRLMTALGSASEFEDYLVALRVNYKIKRNFIKLLDSIKW